MRKNNNDYDYYFLSPEEEHNLLLISAERALKHLATIHVGDKPLPSSDIKNLLNSLKVVDGIASFEGEEKLKKQWEDVDWEMSPRQLASLLASSGKKEVIKHAQLNWKSMVVEPPKQRSSYHQDLELSWLIEVMVKARNQFFEHLSTNYKSSLANDRAQKAFWDALLEKGHVNHDTLFDCKDYINPPQLSLFQLAVVYDNQSLFKRFPLNKAITDKDQAEKTMLCIFNRNVYFSHNSDDKYITRLLNRCIKFSPDLSQVFERKSQLQSLQEIFEKNYPSENPVKEDYNLAHDFLAHAQYEHTHDQQWEKNKNIRLREYLFMHLTGVNLSSNQKIVEYFLNDIKSLPEKEQQNFIETVQSLSDRFPFENIKFVSQVVESLSPCIQKKFFLDNISLLSDEHIGVNILKVFSKANTTFSRDVLKACASYYLSKNNQEKWESEAGVLLPNVFDKDNQNLAKKFGEIISSNRLGEKADISQALWQKDFDENKGRISKSSRLM